MILGFEPKETVLKTFYDDFILKIQYSFRNTDILSVF